MQKKEMLLGACLHIPTLETYEQCLPTTLTFGNTILSRKVTTKLYHESPYETFERQTDDSLMLPTLQVLCQRRKIHLFSSPTVLNDSQAQLSREKISYVLQARVLQTTYRQCLQCPRFARATDNIFEPRSSLPNPEILFEI